MTTFDYKGDTSYHSGEVENGSIYIQLKATDTLEVLADGDSISFAIKRRHAVYWMEEPNPVYLIVYSVKDDTAYWLHMQPYLKAATFQLPPKDQKEFSVHLSKVQKVSAASIDNFRMTKQNVLARIKALSLYD